MTPPPHPLSDRPSFLVARLGSFVARDFAGRLSSLGIQPAHFGLLSCLRAQPGSTQQQIAGTLGVHRNAMVGLVDELEGRNLLERRRHPSDRRAHALHLTDQGTAVLQEATTIADQLDAELLSPFDSDDARTVVRVLRSIAERAFLSTAQPS